MTEPIRVLKGHTGALDVATWDNNGRVLVSLCLLNLDPDRPGEYVRRKGGFACSPAEAREVAAALVAMAETVETGPGTQANEGGD